MPPSQSAIYEGVVLKTPQIPAPVRCLSHPSARSMISTGNRQPDSFEKHNMLNPVSINQLKHYRDIFAGQEVLIRCNPSIERMFTTEFNILS